jgi:hypothetical protein
MTGFHMKKLNRWAVVGVCFVLPTFFGCPSQDSGTSPQSPSLVVVTPSPTPAPKDMQGDAPNLNGSWKFEKASADQDFLKPKAVIFQQYMDIPFLLSGKWQDQSLVVTFESGASHSGKKCHMDLAFHVTPDKKPCGCPLVVLKRKADADVLMDDACIAILPESLRTSNPIVLADTLANELEKTFEVILVDHDLTLVWEDGGGSVQLSLSKLP